MRAEMVGVVGNRLSLLSLVMVVVDNWKRMMIVMVEVVMVAVVMVMVVVVMVVGVKELGYYKGCHMLSTLCMRSGTWKWLLLLLLLRLWLGLTS